LSNEMRTVLPFVYQMHKSNSKVILWAIFTILFS
jgi:hypothetical protein